MLRIEDLRIPLIVFSLATSYVAVSKLSPLLTPQLSMYLFQPLAWALPASLLIVWQRHELIGQLRQPSGLAFGVLFSAAQFMVNIASGAFTEFGWSPYSHAPTALLGNTIYIAGFLVGRELTRWLLVKSLAERSEAAAVVVPWLLLSATAVAPASYNKLSDPDSALRFIGIVVLPTLATQFLATYLAFTKGLTASFGYMSGLMLAEWFSPILPIHPILLAASIGVMVPLVGLMMIDTHSASDDVAESGSSGAELIGPSPSLLLLLAFSVLMFWLNSGILGIRPTIVHGISMQPTYHTGDFIVARDVPTDELRVGDIILFNNGVRDVVHRIIEIRTTEGGLVFITQGDNNEAPDAPVPAEYVIGRIAVHLGKVGWPVVGIKDLLGKVLH